MAHHIPELETDYKDRNRLVIVIDLILSILEVVNRLVVDLL